MLEEKRQKKILILYIFITLIGLLYICVALILLGSCALLCISTRSVNVHWMLRLVLHKAFAHSNSFWVLLFIQSCVTDGVISHLLLTFLWVEESIPKAIVGSLWFQFSLLRLEYETTRDRIISASPWQNETSETKEISQSKLMFCVLWYLAFKWDLWNNRR